MLKICCISKVKQNNQTQVLYIQYNTVKPNFNWQAILLQLRDSFGFKKAKIKKRKIPDSIYLSVHPIDAV